MGTPRRKAIRPRSVLVAESEAMARVVDTIEALAESDVPVLIQGEPGTGRELVARLLHHAGRRATGELLTVDAGAAPRGLWMALAPGGGDPALDGARNGTLVVKDLCELPRSAQRSLGRALRERERHGAGRRGEVRVIGVTDPDLALAVDAELFNRALYERLAAHTVTLPPLRDRGTDIAPLAAQFVAGYARDLGRGKVVLSARAAARLVSYPWPGNVGELKRVARRLVLRCKGSRIQVGDVDAVLPVLAHRVPLEDMAFEDMVRSQVADFLRRLGGVQVSGIYADIIARVEAPLLDLVLERTGGNQLKAAEVLGLNRNTLRRKLAEHGLRARTRGATRRGVRAKRGDAA
jgi:two-component system nitrogen regulation response regulator GlnG